MDLIDRQAAIDVAKAHWYKPDIVGAIEQLPSAQPEQRWIPVTERLPEEDKPVFVYLFYDSPYIAWLSDGVWHTDDFIIDEDHEPAAWMPLPEPYREEGD